MTTELEAAKEWAESHEYPLGRQVEQKHFRVLAAALRQAEAERDEATLRAKNAEYLYAKQSGELKAGLAVREFSDIVATTPPEDEELAEARQEYSGARMVIDRLREELAEAKTALSGRTVSCAGCNAAESKAADLAGKLEQAERALTEHRYGHCAQGKRAEEAEARLKSLEGVVEAAKKWKPTVRGASRDHLIPEALALVDALDAIEAKEDKQ